MGANSSIPANYSEPAYGLLSLNIVLTTASLIGRVFSRRLMVAQVAADDYLTYLAYCTNLGLLVSGILLVSHGAVDLAEVSIKEHSKEQFIKSAYSSLAALYIVSVTLIKLSILFLYRRIFTMFTKWFHHAWWACLMVVCLWTITCASMLLLHVGSKLPNSEFGRLGISITGIINAISDVLILCLPIFMISKIRLQRKQKIALISVFMIGGIASLVSLIRGVIFFINRKTALNEAYSNYLDVVLTATESSAGFMCACLPLCKPLIVRLTRCIQRCSGQDTRHQGWTTMDASATRSFETSQIRSRRRTIISEYDLKQLPPVPSKYIGQVDTDEKAVTNEKGWDQTSPYSTHRQWTSPSSQESDWETQKTWGHKS